MADEPDKDEAPPQGKTASALRETKDLLGTVARWGPQQLNGVAFAVLVVAVVGFLGWRIYSDDKAKAVESQANVDRQAQLLRFMESETEKGRQITNVAVREGQQFYAIETEKQRKYYSEQERTRREEGKVHMREAMEKMDKLGVSIDKLTTAVDNFKRKMEN